MGYCASLKAKTIKGVISLYCAEEQDSSFREMPVESGILCLTMHQFLLQKQPTRHMIMQFYISFSSSFYLIFF